MSERRPSELHLDGTATPGQGDSNGRQLLFWTVLAFHPPVGGEGVLLAA
jgi:hypothetical protein